MAQNTAECALWAIPGTITGASLTSSHQGPDPRLNHEEGRSPPSRRHSLAALPSSQVSSATSSIYEEKTGHDLEKATPPVDVVRNDTGRPKIKLRQRLHHFTWAWFTLTMSTGGLSLLIFAQPFQFPGLRQIGLFFYIVNIILFAVLCSSMLARFLIHRGDLMRSLTHPREGLFFPTFSLSIAVVITSTYRYAIPENDVVMTWAMEVTFWIYVIFSLCIAVVQYSHVFAAHSFGLQTMMPTWILPIFPIMLSGTIASVIAATQPEVAAVPILVGGLTCQGLGMMVSVFMYCHMVGRLMQSGLPNREHRPGLFMCVGPPAFTALAFIGMANGLPDTLDHRNDGISDAALIKDLAAIGAIFLWALALWFFLIAAIAVVASPPKYLHLGWWAMVFPNTGFILATISIGNEMSSRGILWAATGMSICLLGMYGFVLFHMIMAVIRQDIMYPGRDEDVEDH